jgi:hypothetical protein
VFSFLTSDLRYIMLVNRYTVADFMNNCVFRRVHNCFMQECVCSFPFSVCLSVLMLKLNEFSLTLYRGGSH